MLFSIMNVEELLIIKEDIKTMNILIIVITFVCACVCMYESTLRQEFTMCVLFYACFCVREYVCAWV